jgi:hypothetical protein
MCDTCPCNSVSSIPGPVDVAARAARNKGARRVMFWGFAVPMLPFAVWGELHWWTLVLVALAVAAAAGTWAVMRALHRQVVVAPPTPAQRYAEMERRRLKPIPAPAARAPQPALPRAVQRELAWARFTKRAQSLPAPKAKALPAGYVTGKVVPAPARRAAR